MKKYNDNIKMVKSKKDFSNTNSIGSISSGTAGDASTSRTVSLSPKASVFENFLAYANDKVFALNNSKIFAGMMIVIINIASKFVTFKLSKTVESYLVFTFSRDILVFAITWMGTRDIYISLVMTFLFVVFVDYLLNENSDLCCLSESFVKKHQNMLEGMKTMTPSEDEILKAKIVLEKAKRGENNLEDEKSRPVYKDNFETSIYGY